MAGEEAPLQAFSPPYRLTRLAMLDRPVDDVGLDVEAHHKRQVFISQLFAQLAQEDPAVRVVDPAPRLCDDKGLCHAELGGYSLYTDDNHLSEVGARFVAPILEPLFMSLQARENRESADQCSQVSSDRLPQGCIAGRMYAYFEGAIVNEIQGSSGFRAAA